MAFPTLLAQGLLEDGIESGRSSAVVPYRSVLACAGDGSHAVQPRCGGAAYGDFGFARYRAYRRP